MALMWVGRTAYEQAREEADRWREAFFALLEREDPIEPVSQNGDVRPQVSYNPDTTEEREDPTEYEIPIPPRVEQAINRRVEKGSPIHAKLIEDTREAVERLGPDFDEDSYIEDVITGTRVTGFPI